MRSSGSVQIPLEGSQQSPLSPWWSHITTFCTSLSFVLNPHLPQVHFPSWPILLFSGSLPLVSGRCSVLGSTWPSSLPAGLSFWSALPALFTLTPLLPYLCWLLESLVFVSYSVDVWCFVCLFCFLHCEKLPKSIFVGKLSLCLWCLEVGPPHKSKQFNKNENSPLPCTKKQSHHLLTCSDGNWPGTRGECWLGPPGWSSKKHALAPKEKITRSFLSLTSLGTGSHVTLGMWH